MVTAYEKVLNLIRHQTMQIRTTVRYHFTLLD